MSTEGDTERRTEIIKVKVAENKYVNFEATVAPGDEEVALRIPDIREVMDSIESIADALSATLKRVKPSKAAVEFGVEISAESGHLTALILKGSGKGNLKITLEWS